MPYWGDILKFFSLAFQSDPISRKRAAKGIDGVAITQPDIPDIRADNWWGGGNKGHLRLRDSNDFIDLSSVTNRQSRYKEYERLRNMTEIEAALDILSDESCVSGDTLISTPFGLISIEKLAQTKSPDEKFLVYCYDFKANDYSLGWAYHPRKVKTAQTIQILLNNGKSLTLTEDHRVLLRNGQWIQAGAIKTGDKLMPFHRIRVRHGLNNGKANQFPRIFTFANGWKHERQFVDEWRGAGEKYDSKLNSCLKCLTEGLSLRQASKIVKMPHPNISNLIERYGFSHTEIKSLNVRYKDHHLVVGICKSKIIDVYDMSVDIHENFATDTCIVHNCQLDDNKHTFDVVCKNETVKKELEYLYHKILQVDEKIWNWAKNLYAMGDWFGEVVLDPEDPKLGILKVNPLPADSMYRIETTKGKLIEFQQSKEGPDYQSLSRVEVTKATDSELNQATAIRFAPEQIIHGRIGDDRKTYYPYGVSIIDPARGPANSLKLIEDAMIVYRLSRSPERRVFYIDVGGLPPNKAEAFIERLKDQLRKKKLYTNRASQTGGAGSVEERWHAPAMDEDFWLPIRPGGNTRIETLPGACLALDTEIPLLDGRDVTLQTLIDEFKEGKENWVYSCNPETGSPAPGKVTWAGVTRKQTQVVKIHFDNGKTITCTPDHKFPVIGKGKVQAKDLMVGESLIPFNLSKELMPPHFNYEYTSIYNNEIKEWEFVHRMVAISLRRTKYGQEHVFHESNKNAKKNIIHHMDYNRFNNNPSNLYWMNWGDHKLLHQTKPDFVKEKISKSLKSFHENLDSDDPFYDRLREIAKYSSDKLQEKLQSDPEFAEEFHKRKMEGFAKKEAETPGWMSKRTTERNNVFWSDPENKKKVFAKQTINYPQSMFDEFMELLGQGNLVEDILPIINSDKTIINDYVEANKHIVRDDVKLEDGLTYRHAKKMVEVYGYKGIRNARDAALKQSGIIPKLNTHGRQKGGGLKYPKPIMDTFMKLLAQGSSVKEALEQINKNKDLIDQFLETNVGVGYKTSLKNLTIKHVLKMVKSYGYEGLIQARKEAHLYNHKVVKVEWLTELIDTGTITVDGDEEIHNYHTFAIKDICYTFNSNLGEIDDCTYFRAKLLTALHLPKNYLSQDDPSLSKMSLSSQDIKFARYIERLQKTLAKILFEIGERHLILRGYPEEMWEDYAIWMTPPSEYREMSRMEILQARYANMATVIQAGVMSKYDALVEIGKYQPDIAREMSSRAKMQAIEDMKIQVIGQNPDLIGVGQSGENDQELGGEAGGPNPSLGGEDQQQQQQQTPPDQQQQPDQQTEGPAGAKPKKEGKPLPEPTKEDIKKYDLEIRNYSSEKDIEEVDPIETGEM